HVQASFFGSFDGTGTAFYSSPRKELLFCHNIYKLRHNILGTCINDRYEKTLRFPWAADEPPRATHCGVSSSPQLPQESPCFFFAGVVAILFLSLLLPIRCLFGAEDR